MALKNVYRSVLPRCHLYLQDVTMKFLNVQSPWCGKLFAPAPYLPTRFTIHRALNVTCFPLLPRTTGQRRCSPSPVPEIDAEPEALRRVSHLT